MPQGKVIAVQPLGFGGLTLQNATTFSATSSYTSSSEEGQVKGENEIYIGVCRGNIHNCDERDVRAVVWTVDNNEKLQVGDYVEFEYNQGRSKPFKEVTIVKRKKGKVIHFPGGLLPKVALLASLLLLVAVMNDTRR